MGDKEKFNEYRKKLDIMNKMIEEKYDTYKAKDFLGYRRETYAAWTKEKKPGLDKKREKALIE